MTRINPNGVLVPLDSVLLDAIRERKQQWEKSGRDTVVGLMGVWQYGVVELSESEQLKNARQFQDSIVGNCVRCGGSAHSLDEQPSCGHIYCKLHIGRGHADPCSQCEDQGES